MSLIETWDSQYKSKNKTALNDENLFKIEVRAIINAIEQTEIFTNSKKIHLLELGCGTGELIRNMDREWKSTGVAFEFVGVDFSEVAISKANSLLDKNQTFHQSDFLSHLADIETDSVDLVVTQRSIMALMEMDDQKALIDHVYRIITPGGAAVFSECFNNGMDKFNELRASAGLSPLEKVWHSRYLDEKMLEDIFDTYSLQDFCSTYMLITRVVYPFFESALHNQPIHDIAALFPESGETSFLKLAVVGKRK